MQHYHVAVDGVLKDRVFDGERADCWICNDDREQQSPPAPRGCGCELADKGVHVVGCGEVA
jgi:hypothetical protein